MPQPRTYDRYPLVAWLERRSRSQIAIVGVVIGLFLAWQLLRALAVAVLDRWWLQSVTDSPVWRNVIWARVQLIVGAVAVTLILLGGSLWLVHRRGDVPDAEVGGIVRRYRGRMGRAHRWLLVILVTVITWRIGAAASSHWQEWMLFLHGGSVGRDVPELGGDLGDYLFRLPFLAVVSSWLRRLLAVTIGLTLFASAVAGELRLPWSRPGRRPARQAALAHLGILGALFAAVQALDDVFVRRLMQAVDQSGAFVGAGYTQLNVIVPATWIVGVVTIAAGFALVVAARTGRWRVALGFVAAAVVAHIAGFVVIPAIVDRYVVAPAEAVRQLPYVEHNLEATRAAYRLDAVDETQQEVNDGIDTLDAVSDDDVSRMPIWDVTQLAPALQVLQGRTATRITDLDLDRYELDGERRPVMVAARSPSRNDLPENGWVQQHLVYTHGDGVVAVPADRPDADGRPDVEALADEIVTERARAVLRRWRHRTGTRSSAPTAQSRAALRSTPTPASRCRRSPNAPCSPSPRATSSRCCRPSSRPIRSCSTDVASASASRRSRRGPRSAATPTPSSPTTASSGWSTATRRRARTRTRSSPASAVRRSTTSTRR